MTSPENKNGDCYTEEDFEQVAFDRLDPATKTALLTHAATCAKCTSEMKRVAAEIQTISETLRATRRPAGEECFDDEHLARYLDGGLPEAQRETVERHLASCATCQKKLVAIHRETRAILDDLEQGEQTAPSPTHPRAKTLPWPATPEPHGETDPDRTHETPLEDHAHPWKSVTAACAAGAAITAAIFEPPLAQPLVVFALACITFLYTQLSRKTEAGFARGLHTFAGRTLLLIGALLAWGLSLFFPLVAPVLLPAAFTAYLVWLRPTRPSPLATSELTSTDLSEDETKRNSTQSDSR